MNIYGKNYQIDDLRRRVGNMDQLAGVRVVQLEDANQRPGRAALIHTGTGLELTVLLDRCMDIASASHAGRAMGWRSTTGDVAPQYYEPEGLRWLRSYFGGLVTTCGLINVGPPHPDSALNGIGLHGRIGNTPARDYRFVQEWEEDEYVLSVSGTMREASVFGENLTLTRTVSTRLGEDRFWVHDVLVNEGFKDTAYMLLYHCNIGWPALDAGSEMISPSRMVAPRDAEAAKGHDQWHKMDGPTHGYSEKVYYHDMAPAEDGSVTVALVNDGFSRGNGFGVYLKYYKKELPQFVQWKQMGEQEYVVGFEPSTCGVEGREADEKLGLVHKLKAGESKTVTLEFGAVTTPEQVKRLREAGARVQTTLAGSRREFLK